MLGAGRECRYSGPRRSIGGIRGYWGCFRGAGVLGHQGCMGAGRECRYSGARRCIVA